MILSTIYITCLLKGNWKFTRTFSKFHFQFRYFDSVKLEVELGKNREDFAVVSPFKVRKWTTAPISIDFFSNEKKLTKKSIFNYLLQDMQEFQDNFSCCQNHDRFNKMHDLSTL